MGWKVQFSSGKSVEFENEPSPQDIEEADAMLHQKESGGFLQSVGDVMEAPFKGIMKGVSGIRHGFGTMRAMNQGAVPIPEAKDLAAKIFAESEQANQKRLEEIGQSSTPVGQVVEGLGTLGTTIAGGPVTMIPGTLGQTMQMQKQIFDQTGSFDKAAQVAGVQTAANLSSVLIPALKYVANVALNVGTGVTADEISRQLLSEYEEAQRQFSPKSQEYWVQRAVEIVGGVLFAKRGGEKPPPVDNKDFNQKLEEAKQRKTQEPPPPETPEQIAFWKDRAEKMQREASGYDPRYPIQVTPEGRAVNPYEVDQLNMDRQRSQITSEGGSGPGGLLNRQTLDRLNAELNPRIVPDIGLQPPREFDAGVRPTGTDGTPLRGMAEDVPTVDFPLRQEVMDSPETRALTDDVRTKVAQLEAELDKVSAKIEKESQFLLDYEGTKTEKEYETLNNLLTKQSELEAQRSALEGEFQDLMRRHGASKPEDLSGRGLYEGGENARYLETDIRRGGEINPKTFPAEDGVPFEAPKEVVPSPRNTRPFVPKSQRGVIHPTLLGVGAVDSLIKKFGNKAAWNRFRGTFNSRAMEEAFNSAIRPYSPETIVWMTPDDFHKMAFPRTEEYMDRSSVDRTKMTSDEIYGDGIASRGQRRADIESALYSKPEGLDDIPYLIVRIDEDNPRLVQVVGHEGRHRNDIFKKLEVDRIPVKLEISGHSELRSWDAVRDLIGTEPTEMRSEKNYHPVDPGVYMDYYSQLTFDPVTGTHSFPETRIPFPGRAFTSDPVTHVPSIAKKQAGSWIVPSLILEKTRDLINKTNQTWDNWKHMNLPSREQKRQEVVRGIASLNEARFINTDPEATPEAIARIASEPEAQGLWADATQKAKRIFVPGRIAAQEISGKTNQLISSVGRIYENARNRYELARENIVQPIKRSAKFVINNQPQMEMLKDTFFTELEMGRRFQKEELLAMGMPPKVLDFYTKLRDGLDQARDKINAVREAKGMKPISMLDAYMASSWLGPYKTKVFGADNNLVWVIAEPTAYHRLAAEAYLKRHYPDFKFTKMPYEPVAAGKRGGYMEAALDDLRTLLGADNLVTQTVAELMANRFKEKTFNMRGVEQHFKTKTGVKGFAGERPWAIKKNDLQDLFNQQIQYIDSVFRWAEHQDAKVKADAFMKDPMVMETHPNDLKYLEEFIKNQEGRGTLDAVHQLENYAARAFGLNPGMFHQGLGATKTLFYMTKLGLNLPFIMVSFVQPYVSVLPALLAHDANVWQGVHHGVTSGYMMAADLVARDMAGLNHTAASELSKRAQSLLEKPLDTLTKEAIEYARVNRVAELNQLSDVRDTRAGPVRETLEKTVGSSITFPEMVARSNAYMAFVHGLKHKYDTSTHEGRMELYQKAGEITKEAMGDYDPTQKAAIYKRLGIIGDAASVLQTFMMNHLYQTYKYSKMAMPKAMGGAGNAKPFLAYLFSQMMVAGATGLIGVDDAEDFWNFIKRNVMSPEDYNKYKDISIKGAIIDNMPDLVAYGPVSTITGLNISTRFSTADMLRIPPFDDSNLATKFLPFITDGWKQLMALHTLMGKRNATEMEKRQAGYDLTPTGFRGLYEENAIPGLDTSKNFTVRPDGTKVMKRMSDQTSGSVIRTPEDSTIRKTGLKSFREQKAQDQERMARSISIIQTEQMKKLEKRFAQELLDGNHDKLRDIIITAVEIGGDPTNWVSSRSMDQKYYNMVVDHITRELNRLANKKNPSQYDVYMIERYQKIREGR